jgi:hypothetical protein
MKAIENFSRLWNGSEPGWVVVRHTEDRETIRVLLSENGPTMPEVKALRTVAPAFSERPAAEVLAALRGKSEFSLGELESSAARKLHKQCETLGLQVASQGHQVVSHSIINELSKIYLLIEDAATNQAVPRRQSKWGCLFGIRSYEAAAA